MSSSPSSSDPLSSLRSLLEASSVPIPDDGTLAALLAVAGDDVGRAARLILDDHKVSNPVVSRSVPRPAEPSGGLRRRPGLYQPLDFAENEAEYDAAIRGGHAGTGRSGNHGSGANLASLLYSTLALPFSALQSVLLGVLRLLRIPSLLATLFSRAGSTTLDDGETPAAKQFADSMTEMGLIASSSSGFPPFLTGAYNDALKQAKKDLKMLVVILISDTRPESDREFLSNLMASEVTCALSRSEYLLWGASTKRREGHLVARQLSAHHFPFIGCVAMKIPPSMGYSLGLGTAPQLSLVSRASGSALFSPTTLSQHLRDSYSRCSSLLEGLQAERIAQETERRLMAEQDRAFEEASKKDAERVAKKREETRLVEQAREAQREQERQGEERLHKKAAWRRWAKHRMLADPELPTGPTTTSIVAVLPDGRRLARVFSIEQPLEHVYAWIESASVGELEHGEDANAITQPEDYRHVYEFAIFLGYPRRRVGVEQVQQGSKIGDIEGLFPRANVIVEGKIEGLNGLNEGSSGSESSDGE